jgi:hypothetical protein
MNAVERGVLRYWRAWRRRPGSTALATAMAFAMALLVLAYSGATGPSLGLRASSPQGATNGESH